MNAKEFLKELKSSADQRVLTIEKIKRHNLPVIVYGAALCAKNVLNELKSCNIEVEGFAVDAAYYRENMTYMNLPVYNFDELSTKSSEYVFVLGLQNASAIERVLNKNIKFFYSLDSGHLPITFNYISDHIDQFIETCNFLNDDFSRKTFVNYFKLKLSGDVLTDHSTHTPNQYFNGVVSEFKNIRGGGGHSLIAVPIVAIQ